jgi:hypothetical protein
MAKYNELEVLGGTAQIIYTGTDRQFTFIYGQFNVNPWKCMAGYTVLLLLHCLVFIYLHSTNPDKVTETHRV